MLVLIKHIVFMIQSKIIHVTLFLTKRNINTFDVLIFIQMRADKNKFWQIKNTSGCHEQHVQINSQ